MDIGTKIIWTGIIFIIVSTFVGVNAANDSNNTLFKVSKIAVWVFFGLVIMGILINIWS